MNPIKIRMGIDFFCIHCGWRDRQKQEVKELWLGDWEAFRCTRCEDDIASQQAPFPSLVSHTYITNKPK